ncbi:MAG TPA: hypothetical protein DE316_11320 [Eubacterium sp.]|nr:hypothetical protein [Eubacterium sp.]
MNSINLYTLTRIEDNDRFAEYEYIMSERKDFQRTRIREKESLVQLVTKLMKSGVQIEDLDNFFYSYTIAHISKEFDLLKVSSNRKRILNIELKSENVGEERIKQQLVRNRYYLSPVTTDIISYTYILDTNTVYKLDTDNKLYVSDFSSVAQDIRSVKKCMKNNIESLFKAKDYLISPVNSPERFARHQYFLTNQQEAMSRKLLAGLLRDDDKKYYSVKGEAGTGKTLLLYDTVRKLPENVRKCVIHFGRRTPNIDILEHAIPCTDIITSKDLISKDMLSGYSYILVDETQRIHDDQFEWIIESAAVNPDMKAADSCINTKIVMFYDCEQILSRQEQKRAMDKRIEDIADEKYFLSDRIRTNPELSEFIRNMFDLTKRGKGYRYDCVTICYANSINEFKKLKAYYKAKQYIYIDYEKSYKNASNMYKTRKFNAYKVIGKEFDKVLTVIDGKFSYNEYGELCADYEGDNDDIIEKFFYQVVTRAREQLCIIVLNNEDIFKQLLYLLGRIHENNKGQE